MKKLLAAASLTLAVALLAVFVPASPVSWAEEISASDQSADNSIIIYKTNPAWPAPGMITSDPCRIYACRDV
jgi:hypothetical protein